MSSGRKGSREQLSLALMDVRNYALGVYSALEGAWGHEGNGLLQRDGLPPPLWVLGHTAWFQECWIARNPMRHLGRACPALADRPPSLEPRSDDWWSDHRPEQVAGLHPMAVSSDAVRAYLLDSLEQSLALLDETPEEDEALHFFRLALLHEERHAEQLVEMAQVLGVSLAFPVPSGVSARPELLLPATRWRMGLDPQAAGFSPDHERPAHEIPVPEFEIDAQVVTWAQYIEFVDDDGYERPELWQPEGWLWLQAGEQSPSSAVALTRRVPRFVEQMGGASGAVLQRRFGELVRLRGNQPVTHVSWWEAEAWCRWAGRRLPAEVEWDLAAHSVSGRGFRWGDVLEWTGTTARPYPGFAPDMAQTDPMPVNGTHKVVRGASALSRPELRLPGARRFALPSSNHHFCGFRSCAM